MASAITVTEELKTTVKFEEFQQKWADRKTYPQHLKSEVFTIGGSELQVCLSENDGKVQVMLERGADNKMMLHVQHCCLSCVHQRMWSKDAPVLFLPAGDGDSLSWGPRQTWQTYGWPKFATEDEFLAKAKETDGILSVMVVISVLRLAAFVDPSSCLRMSPADLLQTFSNAEAVKIKGAGDCEVSVLDGFLRAHSSVLCAALQSEMEESRTRVIQMPDAEKQALEDLRDCLNSGGLPASVVTRWQRIADLYVLADKYAITPLAKACMFYLSMRLTPINASKMLAISDKYGLVHLRKAAMYFTMSNKQTFEAVVASDEYDAFSADLLRDFAAFEETRKNDNVSKLIVPVMGQWGDAPHEFTDSTDWQTLPKKSLRRACFERLLGTAGTAAELLVRLSPLGDDAGKSEVSEPDAKRQRKDE